MFDFFLDEGVLTVGAVTGIFTANMLNSLKGNVVDPFIENLIPSHKLDSEPESQTTEKFADIMTTKIEPPPKQPPGPKKIKWQTFLRDFITWVILMVFMYLIWKKWIHPYKMSKQPVA